MTTFKKQITTVHPDGQTSVTSGGAATEDQVQNSIEDQHNWLSRQAQRNGNLTSVEEAGGSVVAVFDDGTVMVYQWIKGEQ